jgi:DNA-binding LacI/PurR family transcriptional regulator
VSKATASRVLNGSARVDPTTRRRVLDAMARLEYTPSVLARRLSLGRTLTISVVTSFLTRPQAAERLRGVEAVLSDSEFDLVIYNVETVEKRDQYLQSLALAQRSDGLLVISLPPRP